MFRLGVAAVALAFHGNGCGHVAGALIDLSAHVAVASIQVAAAAASTAQHASARDRAQAADEGDEVDAMMARSAAEVAPRCAARVERVGRITWALDACGRQHTCRWVARGQYRCTDDGGSDDGQQPDAQL